MSKRQDARRQFSPFWRMGAHRLLRRSVGADRSCYDELINYFRLCPPSVREIPFRDWRGWSQEHHCRCRTAARRFCRPREGGLRACGARDDALHQHRIVHAHTRSAAPGMRLFDVGFAVMP